jgi:small subunit ribosomal protein S4
LRNLELTQITPVPDWLVANRDALSGKFSRIPNREEMQPMVNEQLSCTHDKRHRRVPAVR